jgi:hypothetical protein
MGPADMRHTSVVLANQGLRRLVLALPVLACSGTSIRTNPRDAQPADRWRDNPGGVDVIVVSATPSGDSLDIAWHSNVPIQNIWAAACGTAPRLLQQSEEDWVPLQDDRPREGTFVPYFLDGVYYENASLGCDGGNSCYPATGTRLSTLENVQVGTRPPPAPYYPVGGSGPTDAPVPDLVSRATTGPYRLELKYMIGSCPSAEIGTVVLDLPASG